MTALGTGSAHAQTLPDSVRPNQLERQFEQAPDALARPETRQETRQPLPQPDDKSASEDTFKLSSVTFRYEQEGGVIPLQPLRDKASSYLNVPLVVEDLQGLAKGLTAVVRAEGYLLSSVRVPAQSIADGELELVVREGHLAQVIVEGNASEAFVEAWKTALLDDRPLRQATLERVLLTVNRLPGISASGTLFVTEKQEPALKIVLKRDRFDAYASIDNRGSRFIGPWQATAASSVSGLLLPYDQLFVRGLHGTDNQELQSLDGSYETVLNSHGTTLQLAALRTWSEPGFTLEPLKLETLSTRVSATVEHPLLRRRNRNLLLKGGITARNSTAKSFGALLSEDRIRKVHTGITADYADRFGGISLADIEVHQGINAFGARESGDSLLSRANGKSDFTKLTAYLSRTQNFDSPFSLMGQVDGQYTFDQLLSSEEFGYGGAQFGRGYEPSEIVGDHGVAALLEGRYTVDTSASKWLNSAQWYTSYDIGSVWAIDTNTRFNRRTGASFAFGLRLQAFDHLLLDAQLAKPLTRSLAAYSEDDNTDPKGFISAVWRF